MRRGSDRGRLVALIAVATLTVFATMAIAPSLPAMAAAFRDTPNAELLVKLSVTLPAIAIVIAAPLSGWIVDRYGRLPLLFGAMVLFGAGGCAGYFLDDLHAILASRMVLGLAIGASMTTVQTLAGDYFEGAARARYAGLQTAWMSIGAMITVGIAGFIAQLDWRWPFLLYAQGWLLLPLAVWLLDEPPRSGRRIAAGVAAAPARRNELASAYAIAWFGAAMFYMVASQLPFLLAERGHTGPATVGIAIGLVQLFAAVGSALHQRLARGRSYLAVHAIAFMLMGLGYALIWLAPAYALLAVGAALAGTGTGVFFPNCSLWVLAIAPPALRGRASGGLAAAIHLGQFASPLVLQSAVAAAGLGGAFGVAAGILLAVAGVASITAARRAAAGRPA